MDHLGKHKECGMCVCVCACVCACVCVCVTVPKYYLGRQRWEETMVGILVDPIDLEKKKSNPYSSMVPLRN